MNQGCSNLIDSYISEFPESVRAKLQQMRETIQKAAPNAVEKISYGIPTFAVHKNLVHFAAFKNHIGLYALPKTTPELSEELKRYKTGRGSVQFPLSEDLPLGLIEKLVRKRIMEVNNEAR